MSHDPLRKLGVRVAAQHDALRTPNVWQCALRDELANHVQAAKAAPPTRRAGRAWLLAIAGAAVVVVLLSFSLGRRPLVAASNESAEVDFRPLSRAAQYEGAFEAATAVGFERLCDGLAADDLILLGDTARFAGHPREAEHAYQALRRRFPATSQAAVAAFAIARIQFDQRRAYASAAFWFRACMREQPADPLAREAHGRLLEALSKSGEIEEAREESRRYLRLYPSGPFAAQARRFAH